MATKYITIEGFEKLTEQEIFDTAAAHITKTGQPSVDRSENCKYGGLGCNAAPFIKPECIEGADKIGGWEDLEWEDMVPEVHSVFVIKLQGAHDDAAIMRGTNRHQLLGAREVLDFRKEYSANMRGLAEVFELNPGAIDIFDAKWGLK